MLVRTGKLRRMAKKALEDLGVVIGRRARELREERKLTSSAVAERMGFDLPHYSRLESGGRSDPRISTVVRLADALGVTVEHLIGRKH